MTSARTVMGADIRFRIDPRCVPPGKVARWLHVTLAEFDERKGELFARGFPRPDPTTGTYDLKALEACQDAQSALAPAPSAVGDPAPVNASDVFRDRMARLTDGKR
jgi:hypothetical protein